ncbi:MAG TPA: PKD domain-containing protein, partial [Bacteroidia bacterium]|nr:PKD domain-containing protein [Bacteroidia bacterium]
TALFTATVSGATGVFTNLSSNATTYSWNFGDGSPADNTAGPTHEYTANGTYTVTLTVTGPCGTDTYTQVITISQVGIRDNDLANTLSIYPNPNDGRFTIAFEFSQPKDVTVEVLDVAGRVIFNDKAIGISNYNNVIDLSDAGQGMYIVRVLTNEGVATAKIAIRQ